MATGSNKRIPLRRQLDGDELEGRWLDIEKVPLQENVTARRDLTHRRGGIISFSLDLFATFAMQLKYFNMEDYQNRNQRRGVVISQAPDQLRTMLIGPETRAESKKNLVFLNNILVRANTIDKG